MKDVAPSQSLVASFLLMIITISFISIQSESLSSSPQMTYIGGAISSLLFLFSLVFLNDLETLIFGEVIAGWPETILALFVAITTAGSIHSVCTTICFFCCCAQIYWLQSLSDSVYRPVTVISPTKAKKNKKQ